MKTLFKYWQAFLAGLTLPILVPFVNTNNSLLKESNTFKTINYVAGPSFKDILNDVVSNDSIPIFFTNNFTVTLTQELMMGLAILSQTYQNFDKPVIFCVSQDNFYDSNENQSQTDKYNFSSILENAHFVNLLEDNHLQNKTGNFMLYSNTNNFQKITSELLPNQPYFSKQKPTDGTYNQAFQNEYIDNLLSYFDQNQTFDIFVSDLRMYFNGWNHNFDNPITDHSNDDIQTSFYKLLKRTHHIYLMSEGSTDWVTFFNAYTSNINSGEVHFYQDYATKWNQIFASDEITDEYRSTSILDFLNYQDKVTSIDASNGDWIATSSAQKKLENLPDNFDIVIPTLFSYLYFDYFNNDLQNNETLSLIEDFFNLKSNDLVDYLDPSFDNYNEFDLKKFNQKPTLIFLTGKEWSFDHSISNYDDSIAAVKQEMTDLMQLFLKQYPIENYNYVFKFHPNLNKTTIAKNISLIFGEELAKKILVLSSNYAFELLLAKDFVIAKNNHLVGNLFDYNGNFTSTAPFQFKASFAGYDIRTTTIASSLSAINEYLEFLNLNNLVDKTKQICSDQLNFIPTTFYLDGTGYISKGYASNHPNGLADLNWEKIEVFMQYIYESGLVYDLNNFKNLSEIIHKEAMDYFNPKKSNENVFPWWIFMIIIFGLVLACIVYYVLYCQYARRQEN